VNRFHPLGLAIGWLLTMLIANDSVAPRVTNAAPPLQGVIGGDTLCNWLPTSAELGKLKKDSTLFRCVASYDFSYPGGHREIDFWLRAPSGGSLDSAKE